MEQKEKKVWETPIVHSLSVKNFTLSGPGKGQPEGAKPGKGLGGTSS